MVARSITEGEAAADGEGVFLFGDGERLLEGGVVAPAVDGGPGDGGELGSRGHGGACGEGLKNRDLSRGKGFHAWFQDNPGRFSHNRGDDRWRSGNAFFRICSG
jgi:hypothetical protein